MNKLEIETLDKSTQVITISITQEWYLDLRDSDKILSLIVSIL